MIAPLRDYTVALVVLLASLGSYQLSITRFLSPPPPVRAAIAERELITDDGSIADLFPESAWQRGRSIRLKTSDGMLLFQNSQQSNGKTWKLWPITIVIGRGLAGEGSPDPILIESSDGAVIEFDASLDIMSGVAPSIARGQMLGSVRIQRVNHREDAPPNDNSPIDDQRDGAPLPQSAYQLRPVDETKTLDIQTSNVGIDRRRIWTPDAIHMRVGRARMVGRDLTLHLTASASGNQRPNGPRSDLAGALDRMELIYLRELTLPLGETTASGEGARGTVDVRCGGRIEYDFALDQLELDRDVRLLRLPPRPGIDPLREPDGISDEPPPREDWIDRFECDTLKLTLRDPLNSDINRDKALDWIDRVEATGTPLRATFREQALDLVAGRIVFDPIEGVLLAEPMGPPSGPTLNSRTNVVADEPPPTVRLRRGTLDASLSRVIYRFDPKTPDQLGIVEVDRGGVVVDISPTSPLRQFAWQRLLRLEPLAPATPDAPLVEYGVLCEGGLKAELADGGQFHADHVEGVLRPTGESPTAGSLNQRLTPDRFAITGNVQIASRTLDARTEQLDLFFDTVAESPATIVASPKDPAAPGGSLQQWVRQPSRASSAANAGSGQVDSTRGKPPATIRGDRVIAKLTLGGGELTATDLNVVGHVEVTQSMDSAATGGQTLAVMTGEQLRMRSGSGDDVLQLVGSATQAAKLQSGDGHFIGSLIKILPNDNYVSIPGPGEFVVPSHLMPSLAAATRQPPRFAGDDNAQSAAHWINPPKCRFAESLTFDGQIATLAGGVDLDAKLMQDGQISDIQLRGDELTLRVAQPVQFNMPETLRNVQLAEVSLLQTSDRPVDVLVDRRAADGVRDSRHHLQTQRLTWVPAASPATPGVGQIVAPGPGSYRAWLRSLPGASTDLAQGAGATSSRPNGEDISSLWPGMIESGAPPDSITGIHLIYQESMQGDLSAQTLTFQRGVRIGRQLLPDFDHAFDAAAMDRLAVGDMTLDCQRLQLALDPAAQRFASDPPAWELDASQGVIFRTRNADGSYVATAERCSYAAVKDLFMIQGSPTQPARLQQTNALGQPGINLALLHATLKLRTMELITSQVQSFQMGALPASQRQ